MILTKINDCKHQTYPNCELKRSQKLWNLQYTYATQILLNDMTNKVKVKLLSIAISGICLGIFEGSHCSHRAAPEPMCLPTMTQEQHEHATQCIKLVHANELRIAP